jgi:dTDP-4-dehydrorhamnose reductase
MRKVRKIWQSGEEDACRPIHISTDYVFDGKATVPYKEDNPISPIGVYGRTKAEGEKRIQAADPDAIIIRTAWLYGQYGKNFVSTMLGLMNGKSEISVVPISMVAQHGRTILPRRFAQ